METLNFSWDNTKAKTNFIKHKISFEEAKTVFDDDNARLIDDHEHSIDENRFIMLGMSYQFKIIIVVHCYRNDDNNIRIISARKSTKTEAIQYKEYLS